MSDTPADDPAPEERHDDEQTNPGGAPADGAVESNEAVPEPLPDEPTAQTRVGGHGAPPPVDDDFVGEPTNPNIDGAATPPDHPLYHPESDPGLGAGGAAGNLEPEAVVEPPEAPTARLPSILESLLLATDKPVTVAELAALLDEPDRSRIEGALVLLEVFYADRGIQLQCVGGGWQLRTHPRNAPWVQKVLAQKPVRLSRAQLETLAIVGYRQPITRPEVDDIRGVDSGNTLKALLERDLLRILGKKEEPGRPLLYGTTRQFLEFFNLRDLRDLPTLREYHELSEEHRAQVAALEQKAAPGTIEPEGLPAPISRVDLPDVPEEDLSKIDRLIDEAGARATAAAQAVQIADAPPPPPAEEP